MQHPQSAPAFAVGKDERVRFRVKPRTWANEANRISLLWLIEPVCLCICQRIGNSDKSPGAGWLWNENSISKDE